MASTSLSNDGSSVSQRGLPSGLRFRPTDEELVCDYLTKKVYSESIELRAIAEVELSKFHPQELPEKALNDDKHEWYFFNRLQKKYPRGSRPNRVAARGRGYWKATGTDKKIFKANHFGHMLVGLRKSLVYYDGHAPKGEKTNWIMHEYRLPPQTHHSGSTLDWVLCRIYNKHSQRLVGREVGVEIRSMLSEFDEQIRSGSPPQEQGVVDNAIATTPFPLMMHNTPGAMSSTVPGMQQTIDNSSSWTSQHTMASSSQHARFTPGFPVQTGLPTGPALNHWPQFQQFHQGPQSSASFTGRECFNVSTIGADAGQRSSFSDDLGEVQSQFENFTSFGEGALYPGFDHPPADDQSSTYSCPNGMGNFGYRWPSSGS